MRLFVTTVLVALLLIVAAPAASAHDPIFIDEGQTTPDSGPYMPDGTISWALYGSVLESGDTRGFEFDLREGDELYVSLLIPNLAPEVDLGDDELPVIELESPDGSIRKIAPEVRETFDEPFSNTSYVTLAEIREPGQAGRYRGLVVGDAPARFTVAIGETEIFFTETERSGDRPSTFLDISGPLNEWYSTPPGGEPIDQAEEASIQLDLIEEAMESGVAEAPEDAMGDTAAVVSADEVPNENGAGDDGDAEPEPTEVAAEEADAVDGPADPGEDADDPDDADDGDEIAAAPPVATAEGGGAGWVAPVVVGVIAVAAAGAFAVRRRATER